MNESNNRYYRRNGYSTMYKVTPDDTVYRYELNKWVVSQRFISMLEYWVERGDAMMVTDADIFLELV